MRDPKPNLPANFEMCEGGYACFHPAGEFTLAKAVDIITNALNYCRENNIERLLIEATQIGGFPSPTIADRYWIARGFADAAKQAVIAGFALPAYLLDPEKFGVTVATNMGMKTNAFDNKADALAWLLRGPDLPGGSTPA